MNVKKSMCHIGRIATTRLLWVVLMAPWSVVASAPEVQAGSGEFVTVSGTSICYPSGTPLLLRGINLGNWLVPEGYMFKLDSATSPRMINSLLTELVGPDEAREFWKTFRHTFITLDDIRYIRSIGLNSVRVPFNARLFISEEFEGVWSDQAFTFLDRLVSWCKQEHLWVIFDMHCAPGGQTGDNIDDSWGYPHLFENVQSQERTIELWRKIAQRYALEPAVIGYDLLNEPIAHFFNTQHLNPRLEPMYKRIVAAIRTVDSSHIVFLGGAQWDTDFSVFGAPFDARSVYTFHRYWCDTTQSLVQEYVDFRTTHKVPIWMGESGENTDRWIDSFRRLLERNAIGWCFWPFKRMDAGRCVVTFNAPAEWSVIQTYDRARGTGYASIRSRRPDPGLVRRILQELLRHVKFDSCRPNVGYIRALGCTVPSAPELR